MNGDVLCRHGGHFSGMSSQSFPVKVLLTELEVRAHENVHSSPTECWLTAQFQQIRLVFDGYFALNSIPYHLASTWCRDWSLHFSSPFQSFSQHSLRQISIMWQDFIPQVRKFLLFTRSCITLLMSQRWMEYRSLIILNLISKGDFGQSCTTGRPITIQCIESDLDSRAGTFYFLHYPGSSCNVTFTYNGGSCSVNAKFAIYFNVRYEKCPMDASLDHGHFLIELGIVNFFPLNFLQKIKFKSKWLDGSRWKWTAGETAAGRKAKLPVQSDVVRAVFIPVQSWTVAEFSVSSTFQFYRITAFVDGRHLIGLRHTTRSTKHENHQSLKSEQPTKNQRQYCSRASLRAAFVKFAHGWKQNRMKKHRLIQEKHRKSMAHQLWGQLWDQLWERTYGQAVFSGGVAKWPLDWRDYSNINTIITK